MFPFIVTDLQFWLEVLRNTIYDCYRRNQARVIWVRAHCLNHYDIVAAVYEHEQSVCHCVVRNHRQQSLKCVIFSRWMATDGQLLSSIVFQFLELCSEVLMKYTCLLAFLCYKTQNSHWKLILVHLWWSVFQQPNFLGHTVCFNDISATVC